MFFRKRESRRAPIVPDWRKVIPQAPKIGDTASAKDRQRRSYLQTFFVLISAVTMVVIIAVVTERLLNGGGSDASLPMSRLSLETNGALTEPWVRDFVNPQGKDSDISVIALQRKLESYPQIRRAQVSRGNGNTLRIRLEERMALARIRLANGKLAMLGDDGVLFPAETYFKNVQNDFPLVTDVLPNTQEPVRVVTNPALLDFLNFTLKNYPRALHEWESISGKDIQDPLFSADLPQPWAVLHVKPYMNPDSGFPNIREIIFSAQNFREELKLLCSPDTARKVREHFERNAGSAGKKHRIVFVVNRKNERLPHLEMRIIPIQSERRSGRPYNR